jgi:hypothetical protein
MGHPEPWLCTTLDVVFRESLAGYLSIQTTTKLRSA